jgi:hypothetical protein
MTKDEWAIYHINKLSPRVRAVGVRYLWYEYMVLLQNIARYI